MTSERPFFCLTRGWLVIVSIVSLAVVAGCRGPQPIEPLQAPYEHRQVWAVVPLLNESGSGQADGLWVADHLARQLETASPLTVIPVNRVLAAMQALELSAVTEPAQAQQLRRTLGVDGLVVGTITDYDPYDPPRLGIALELYTNPDPDQPDAHNSLELREIMRAPTDELSRPDWPSQTTLTGGNVPGLSPVSSVSGQFNASDPALRQLMQRYAVDRGPEAHSDAEWRLYRMSIERYTEFISYVISDKLLAAEALRLERTQSDDTEQSETQDDAASQSRGDRFEPLTEYPA